MTQEQLDALLAPGSEVRLRLLWQTRDGAFGLVERDWGDGDVTYGLVRADGRWLQVDHEFLLSLRDTVQAPALGDEA